MKILGGVWRLMVWSGPVLSMALWAGCGSDQGGGSTGPMVKDAPPAPGEMTSDDFMKQQNARTKAQ